MRTSRKYRRDTIEESYRDVNIDGISKWRQETLREMSLYCTNIPEIQNDLISVTESIIANNIPGDVVECGVFLGGSIMTSMHTLKKHNNTTPVWLFDTFDGVPVPEAFEVDHDGTSLRDYYLKNRLIDGKSFWCYSNLETVKENVNTVGYKGEINYIKGLVEDTIPSNGPESISILRIDVDLALPTLHILEHFYDRVVPGGYIIFDDYGYFKETQRIIDEFLLDKSMTVNSILPGHHVYKGQK
tara:strand:+ start:980 stop:1708 length:729 start_codon:yes stop_codon:yes gene_type:complete